VKLEPRLVPLSASGDLDISTQQNPFLAELKVKSMVKAKCEGFIDSACTVSLLSCNYVLIFIILVI